MEQTTGHNCRQCCITPRPCPAILAKDDRLTGLHRNTQEDQHRFARSHSPVYIHRRMVPFLMPMRLHAHYIRAPLAERRAYTGGLLVGPSLPRRSIGGSTISTVRPSSRRNSAAPLLFLSALIIDHDDPFSCGRPTERHPRQRRRNRRTAVLIWAAGGTAPVAIRTAFGCSARTDSTVASVPSRRSTSNFRS